MCHSDSGSRKLTQSLCHSFSLDYKTFTAFKFSTHLRTLWTLCHQLQSRHLNATRNHWSWSRPIVAKTNTFASLCPMHLLAALPLPAMNSCTALHKPYLGSDKTISYVIKARSWKFSLLAYVLICTCWALAWSASSHEQEHKKQELDSYPWTLEAWNMQQTHEVNAYVCECAVALEMLARTIATIVYIS